MPKLLQAMTDWAVTSGGTDGLPGLPPRIRLGDVMAMPCPLARDFAAAAARIERERLIATAVACRATQAEEKGWKAWLREIGEASDA